MINVNIRAELKSSKITKLIETNLQMIFEQRNCLGTVSRKKETAQFCTPKTSPLILIQLQITNMRSA